MEYLIYTYSNNKEILTVVNEKDLFKIITSAKEDETKICVYKIGRCLIDRS